MAYRLGTYAGRHTLYDELDPSVAAARRAMDCPVSDLERDSQWALLDHHKDRRRLQAVELEWMKSEQRSMPKCGKQNCWCDENPGCSPDPGMPLGQHSKEYIPNFFAGVSQTPPSLPQLSLISYPFHLNFTVIPSLFSGLRPSLPDYFLFLFVLR